MSTERTVRIVEQDGRTVYIVAEGPEGKMEVMAEMHRQGDRLILHGVHVEGAGPGSMGVGALRTFARLLGKQQDAETVVVHGGRRTTGAAPGRVPKPVEIDVQ